MFSCLLTAARYVCERGWSIFNSHSDDHCYKFNTTTLLNWGDAEKACKKLGGDLATIRDSSSQSYLNSEYTVILSPFHMFAGCFIQADFEDIILYRLMQLHRFVFKGNYKDVLIALNDAVL